MTTFERLISKEKAARAKVGRDTKLTACEVRILANTARDIDARAQGETCFLYQTESGYMARVPAVSHA